MRPCDPCHIKSKGSGGPDSRENIFAMCRKHHSEQHAIGIISMWNKYPIFKMKLSGMGWVILNGKLFNENV